MNHSSLGIISLYSIQCRLGYWLVSKNLLSQVKECNIIPVSFSDHAAVSFKVQSNDFVQRGPGFFKFNNSLLNDKCFVEGLKKKISEYKRKCNCLEGNRLYWDMLKMEIRSFICYCKRDAKEKKDEEAMLQQQLSSLHKLMCENPLQDTIAKCYEVKLKIEHISKRKKEGAMIRLIRSKARWCEQGERNTRETKSSKQVHHRAKKGKPYLNQSHRNLKRGISLL